jgi:hypothetical protein
MSKMKLNIRTNKREYRKILEINILEDKLINNTTG